MMICDFVKCQMIFSTDREKRHMKKKHRLLAVILVASMCMGMMPGYAWADDVSSDTVGETISEMNETNGQSDSEISIVEDWKESDLIPEEAANAGTDDLSNPRTEAITNEAGDNDLKTKWDCIYFGNYPQSDKTGAATERIKWRVLSVDGNDAFLLADQILDTKMYHNESETDITWATCSLRAWLNSDFYEVAFSASEKEAILTTTVVNEDNLETEGGIDTQDKLFLLSISEARNENYGFPNRSEGYSNTLSAKNTEYVINKDVYNSYLNDGKWWLRSPGVYSNSASYVDMGGEIWGPGGDASCEGFGVRPALHIDLSSAKWTYAGTVCSDTASGDTEQPTLGRIKFDDLWSFENPTERIADFKKFEVFGIWTGGLLEIAHFNMGKKGLCKGMCTSAAAILDKGVPSLNSLGINSLKELTKSQVKTKVIPNMNMTLYDFIEYAHIFQFSGAWQNFLKDNLGNLDRFYGAICDYFYDDGETFIITLKIKNDNESHALLPISVRESDNEVILGVYDCNDPHNEHFIKLTREDGHFTGFEGEIKDLELSDIGLELGYTCLTDDFISYIMDRKYGTPGVYLIKTYGFSLNPFINEADGLFHYFSLSDGDLSEDGQSDELLWADEYDVPLVMDSLTAGKSVKIITEKQIVDIIPNTTAPVVITPHSDDELSVHFEGEDNADKTIKIITGTDLDSIKETSLKLNGKKINIDIHGNNVETIGAEQIDIVNVEGTFNESGEVEGAIKDKMSVSVINPDKPYNIDISKIEKSNNESDEGDNKNAAGKRPIEISKAVVSGIKNATYRGKAIIPKPIVKLGTKTLIANVDYTVSYSKNINVGTATITITGKGSYTGMITKTFKITKAKQPMIVKAKQPLVKASKLKKKAQTIKKAKAFTIKKAKGKITFKKIEKGSSKNLIINKKTGAIKIKEGTKKDTYKIKVKVTAAGNKNFKKGSKTVTVKVTVK